MSAASRNLCFRLRCLDRTTGLCLGLVYRGGGWDRRPPALLLALSSQACGLLPGQQDVVKGGVPVTTVVGSWPGH